MRKFFFSFIFVLVGSCLWWAMSNSARFSIKKWDAKFDTIIRHNLFSMGWKDSDIISSVQELQDGVDGQWMKHTWTLKDLSAGQRGELKNLLQKSGARVKETVVNGTPTLLVHRGSRVYQEIRFKS